MKLVEIEVVVLGIRMLREKVYKFTLDFRMANNSTHHVECGKITT